VTAIRALQAALDVEHRVVYGYGVVGAHLTGGPRRLAARRLAAHQLLRDRVAAIVAAAGASPVVAQPAYALPFPVEDAAAALRLASDLEDAVAGAAWDLTAASRPETDVRHIGVTTLAAAWRRLVRGSVDPALPGRPLGSSAQPAPSQPSITPTSSPSSSMTASGSTS
jgi:hypothetical protein